MGSEQSRLGGKRGPAVSFYGLVAVGCDQAVLLDINPIGPLPRFGGREPSIVI
jgi:hypothetical protein